MKWKIEAWRHGKHHLMIKSDDKQALLAMFISGLDFAERMMITKEHEGRVEK